MPSVEEAVRLLTSQPHKLRYEFPTRDAFYDFISALRQALPLADRVRLDYQFTGRWDLRAGSYAEWTVMIWLDKPLGGSDEEPASFA